MNDEIKKQLKEIIKGMKTMEFHLCESTSDDLKQLGEVIERWYQILEGLVEDEYREEDSITETVKAILKDLA